MESFKAKRQDLPISNRIQRSPIVWAGGKALVAKEIIAKFPKHTAYCEVFMGGGAVLLNKPKSTAEAINDLDGLLVNFFRVVKYHLEELIRELEFMPASRLMFSEYIQQEGLTDIQIAATWFYRNAFGFAGKPYFGTSRKDGGACHVSRTAKIEKIRLLNQRLDDVCIENLDWRKFIELYDCGTTLFFCDPPYLKGEQKLYYQGFGWSDHVQLRDALLNLKGKFVLTYDDCQEIRDLYGGCEFTEFNTLKGIDVKSKDRSFSQLIITRGEANA